MKRRLQQIVASTLTASALAFLPACTQPSNGPPTGPGDQNPPATCDTNPAVEYWQGLGGSPALDVSVLGDDCRIEGTDATGHALEDKVFLDLMHDKIQSGELTPESAQTYVDRFGKDEQIRYDEQTVIQGDLQSFEELQDRGMIVAGAYPNGWDAGASFRWFPEDLMLPNKHSDEATTGFEPNPGTGWWSMLNHSTSENREDWYNWLYLEGHEECRSQVEGVRHAFDFHVDPQHVEEHYNDTVPTFWHFPFEGKVREVFSFFDEFFQDYEYVLRIQSTDHSRDLINTEIFYAGFTHIRGADTDGDGLHEPEEFPLKEGDILKPASYDENGNFQPGEFMGYLRTYDDNLRELDANYFSPDWGYGPKTNTHPTISLYFVDLFWDHESVFEPEENKRVMMNHRKYRIPVYDLNVSNVEPVDYDYSIFNPCTRDVDAP